MHTRTRRSRRMRSGRLRVASTSFGRCDWKECERVRWCICRGRQPVLAPESRTSTCVVRCARRTTEAHFSRSLAVGPAVEPSTRHSIERTASVRLLGEDPNDKGLAPPAARACCSVADDLFPTHAQKQQQPMSGTSSHCTTTRRPMQRQVRPFIRTAPLARPAAAARGRGGKRSRKMMRRGRRTCLSTTRTNCHPIARKKLRLVWARGAV